MSMNKKLLVAAIGSLLVAGNASAAIDLDAATPRVYARELVKPVLLTDTADNLNVKIGYNFSQGEVRYGRLECTTNATLTVNGTPGFVAGGSGDLELGAVNGINTSALFFSITDLGANTTATALDQMNFDVNTTLLDNNDVSCAFSIYDQPSQAQAGGTTGRIYSTGMKVAYRSAASYVFTTSGGKATADVAATPSYTRFVGNNLVADYGSLSFTRVSSNVPLNKDGTTITLGAIFAPTTSVVVTGNYAAAAASAWNTNNGVISGTTTTTWTGATAAAGGLNLLGAGTDGRTGVLTYAANGTTEIPVGTFSATLNAVANSGFVVPAFTSLTLVGEIDRNGTQLQAPLAQLPTGYLSRIAITNTGSVARPYAIKVIGETGNVISTNSANMSGVVPANGMKFFELNTVITGFSAGTRAAVIVTVDAPTTDIQAAYQIVNPANGTISNHVMVRPGTN